MSFLELGRPCGTRNVKKGALEKGAFLKQWWITVSYIDMYWMLWLLWINGVYNYVWNCRTASVLSRPETPALFLGAAPIPLVAPPWLLGANEFNASQFDQSLRGHGQSQGPATKSLSLADLRSVSTDITDGPQLPRKTMSVVDFPVAKQRALPQTQSLDRRLFKQVGYSPQSAAYFSDRIMGAYFPATVMVPPLGRDMYGHNIHTFYPGKPKSRSKHSLGSDSDDFQKYRDIAL